MIKLSSHITSFFYIGCILTILLAGCGVSTNANIDWVDLILFQNIRYVRQGDIGRSLSQNDLGTQFATVQFQLNGHISDPSYVMHNGDATYLDIGTPIYTMNGYSTTFRLIAKISQDKFAIYEVQQNSTAHLGSDLLDIRDKVISIDIAQSQNETSPMTSITSIDDLKILINTLMTSSVNQLTIPSGPHYFLIFHLRDGTIVSRSYYPTSSYLEPGIIVPSSFVNLIQQNIK